MPDARPWFQLSSEEILALPVDELGLRILVQIGQGSEREAGLLERLHHGGSRSEAPAVEQVAIEAFWWLIAQGLLAPVAENIRNPQDSHTWWKVTPLGGDVIAHGLARLRAGQRVEMDLHPRIAADVRAEFLRGKFETAVWGAMREVEIAVREASGADERAYGQQLLNFAFAKETGALISSGEAEEQAIANLFRGAIGALKNPYSHRAIEIVDPVEAAEIVVMASFLLRVLDRLSAERGTSVPPASSDPTQPALRHLGSS